MMSSESLRGAPAIDRLVQKIVANSKTVLKMLKKTEANEINWTR